MNNDNNNHNQGRKNLWKNLHGKVVEEALPAGRPLQKVIHTTLNGQREVVLLATVGGRVEEEREVPIDGRSRVVGGALAGLVQLCRRRRVSVDRGRALGVRRRRQVGELDRGRRGSLAAPHR